MEGANAVVEFARKWGIKVKGIKSSEMLVLGASDNYHGVGSGIWRIMKDIGDLVPQGSTTGYLVRVFPLLHLIVSLC
jgi:ornithine--oxo-acid transaminase